MKRQALSAGCSIALSVSTKRIPQVGRIPKVLISQPEVEQIHKYLEQALGELSRLHAIAEVKEIEEIQKRIEEVEYLVQAARQTLPPTQLKLPLK